MPDFTVNQKTVRELLTSERDLVDTSRDIHNLSSQGELEIRVTESDLDMSAEEFDHEYGSLTNVANSKSHNYMFVTEDITVAAANGGELFDVQAWEREPSNLPNNRNAHGSMRHRGINL
jgi:hypothetical protein